MTPGMRLRKPLPQQYLVLRLCLFLHAIRTRARGTDQSPDAYDENKNTSCVEDDDEEPSSSSSSSSSSPAPNKEAEEEEGEKSDASDVRLSHSDQEN